MPSSSRKIEANRENSKHSTGPKSEAGKSAARLNALKHGLLAQTPLLPHENRQVFVEFENSIIGALAPDNGFKDVLVERIVLLAWRLRRIAHVESGLLANGLGRARLRKRSLSFGDVRTTLLMGSVAFVSAWRRPSSTRKMKSLR